MDPRRLPRRQWPAAFAIVATLGLAPFTADAQGTGRSMDLDPSPRASGMGGASNAVFWDEVTNHWSNPALLGYQRGLSYEYGKTQLVPGLAADVHFTTNVLKLGGGGIGLAFSGKPFGVGGLHLSYGESVATDDQGNPIGTFESFEQIDSWSFGVSAVRAAEALLPTAGDDARAWSRYGDVSFGMTGKHLEMDLAVGVGGAQAETDAYDLGFLARFSPSELIPDIRDVIGLDLSYGWSDLSFASDPVNFGISVDEVSEHERRGYAGRLTVDWPDMASQMAGANWIWDGLRPLVSLGYADDHARIGTESSRYETDANGWEITIANVYTWRGGHYEDLEGGIDGDTDGWGVGIPIGQIAGVRYDFAHFPQSSGFPELERRSYSAWIDAMKIWRMTR